MVRHRLVISVAAALAAAALTAGCGGGGGSTDTAPENPISKAQFVSIANRVCGERDQAVHKKALEAVAGDLKGAQLRSFVEGTLVPHALLALDRLRTLPPPAGDSERVTQVLDAAERDIERLRKNPELIRGGDAFARSDRLARAYGLGTCARG